MISHLGDAASARYAVYFAPAQDSLLWQAGCRWLGRDAANGETQQQPAVPGWPPGRVHRITASARLYGLHATLKAPFHLLPGCDPQALDEAIAAFADARAPLAGLQLVLAPLAGFLALQPSAPGAPLLELAAACVRAFDAFRRPPDTEELRRRRAGGLSARQDTLLLQFGYPYVLDEFRFHITLTDRLAPDEMDSLQPWLAGYFLDALRAPLTLSDICLFVQDAPGVPFRLARRYPLRAR